MYYVSQKQEEIFVYIYLKNISATVDENYKFEWK